MRNRRLCITVLTVFFGLAASVSTALEVKLQVTNSEEVAREPALVTSGVPFAKGAVRDVSNLTVSANGQAIPAQFVRTVPWDDGSVRWALLDTQVELPAEGSAELVVSQGGRNPAPAAPVSVEETANAVNVTTGPLALVLSKREPGFIQSLKIDDREMLTAAGKGLVIFQAEGGEVIAGPPADVEIEHAGPMRAVVRLSGPFPGVHDGLIHYTARVSVFAGQPYVRVHLWLENHGADGQGDVKPEWFAFDSMAVDLGLGLGDNLIAASEGVEARDRFRVLQLCKKGETAPYFTDENFEYTITSGDEELKKGDRTDGLVQIRGDAGSLTTGIRHFWQNYEKAIELDGPSLRLWLWPTEGQWPRPTPSFRSRWLERLRNVARPGLYMLPGSVHKGHEFVLDFGGRPVANTAADLSRPVFARATPDYYAATGALPFFFAPPDTQTGNRQCDFKLGSWMRMSSTAADPESESSVYAARSEYRTFNIGYHGDSSQWYGWMDFGDLSMAGRGQVSLHYDWPLLIMLEYLRHGDPNALELATQMVWHRVDVDQYWSDRDPANVNAIQSGTVWPSFHAHGRRGGPSPGGTWATGPALWYMLTGEPKARDAAIRSAEGLVPAWEAIAKSRVYGGGLRVDMAANAWAIESFCAVHDLTADQRWLDEAMKLFNTNVVNKWQSHGPHLHSPGTGQIRGQSYIKEDMKFCFAIGPLLGLHARTGDEQVLKLLREAVERPFPEDSYFEAPMFIAGLYAYVGMTDNKPEYMRRAAQQFALGFPESRNPPVFLPQSPIWSFTSAVALRSGYPVQHAFWKHNTRE